MRTLYWLMLAIPLAGGCGADDKTGDETGSVVETDTDTLTDTDTDTDTGSGTDTGDGIVDEDGDGFAANNGDCDDSNPEIHPDAEEVCDEVDNDCDDLIDDEDDSLNTTTATTWYADSDGDGYGDEEATLVQCTAPSDYVEESASGFDCDDEDPAFHPGADESDCSDPNDYNCDGSIAYADADDDGWAACEECDDGDPDVHPDAVEVCDELDNDCDGQIDDEDDSLDTGTTLTWYADVDGDGYGDEDTSVLQCVAPSGYVAESASGFDCDDEDPAFHPGADESDCADPHDYNCDGSVAYTDDDGDGWAACEECDDGDALVHPDASEICNEIDDNCDGRIDDADPEVIDGTTWYIDYDDDGFGATAYTHVACEAPSGWVASDTDCEDTDPAIHPDGTEVCNEVDDDCDGDIDDADPDVADASTWYADTDLDGYGDADATTASCAPPSGYVADSTDCDDDDASVHPTAAEQCNEIDDDCDGYIDDADLDVTGTTTWYADADLDGYGDADVSTAACVPPEGYLTDTSDCDDTDGAVHPAATELCNEIDDDCDGYIDDADPDVADPSTWYADADLDGYGDAGVSATSCVAPSGYVADDTDCDDDDVDRSPGATEVDGDGVDNNCVNDPPQILSLSLTPYDARTDDTLSLSIEASDPDGDAITHAISWSVDGTVVSLSGTELDGTYFSRDQVVTAQVTPTDGSDDGDPTEASLTIANTPPGSPEISVSPASPNPSVDALYCGIDAESYDADADTISYIIAWTVDGSSFTDTETTSLTGDTVPALSVGASETWVCSVTPSDGTDAGEAVEASVTSRGEHSHYNGVGVTWYNSVPTGTITDDQARLSCEASHGSCSYCSGDCAGPGWCQGSCSGQCWGWESGCSGGSGRVWQYGGSYTTYGYWD